MTLASIETKKIIVLCIVYILVVSLRQANRCRLLVDILKHVSKSPMHNVKTSNSHRLDERIPDQRHPSQKRELPVSHVGQCGSIKNEKVVVCTSELNRPHKRLNRGKQFEPLESDSSNDS